MKEKSDSKTDDVARAASTPKHSRLLCRGCSKDCRHYAICDGRPWRTLTRDNTTASNSPGE